jgi:hypothetical protein
MQTNKQKTKKRFSEQQEVIQEKIRVDCKHQALRVNK